MASEPMSRVCLVDDEPLVARMIVRMLKGFHVDVYERGADAIRALAEGLEADAVILDMHLPDMTGVGIFRRLEDVRPDLRDRVLFLTGSPTDADMATFLRDHGERTLHKPFPQADLLRKLHLLLGRGPGR